MAQEYIALQQKNEIGLIALSKSVFQTIAAIAVEEEDNISLADSTPFYYPLSCKIKNDQLILSLDIKVKYNVNTNEVCSRLQNKIYESISHMTDYIPDIIDVHVLGFIFD